MAEEPPNTSPDEEAGGPVKPFLEHLEDLRWVLLKSLAVLFLGVVAAGALTRQILDWLKYPLKWAEVIPDTNQFLISTGPAEIFLAMMYIWIFGGLAFAMPFILYFIADFVLPALKSNERQHIAPYVLGGVLLFLAGICFCFYVLLPPSLAISYKLTVYFGMQPMWRFQQYLSFVLWLLLGMGLAFELPIILLFLVRIGILDAKALRRGWRWGVMGCLAFSAIITPQPDPLSMFVFAAPLYALYEISVWLAYLMEWRGRRRVAREEADEKNQR